MPSITHEMRPLQPLIPCLCDGVAFLGAEGLLTLALCPSSSWHCPEHWFRSPAASSLSSGEGKTSSVSLPDVEIGCSAAHPSLVHSCSFRVFALQVWTVTLMFLKPFRWCGPRGQGWSRQKHSTGSSTWPSSIISRRCSAGLRRSRYGTRGWHMGSAPVQAAWICTFRARAQDLFIWRT